LGRRIVPTTQEKIINTKRPDVDYLFYLSEITFAVELALAKATEHVPKKRNSTNT